MEFMQNMLLGAFNPRQNLIQSSQRGGLPEIIDMLQAYPSYFFERQDLEQGNKIILPEKVLLEITERHDSNIPNPLIFSLSSLRNKNTVYVGVLEFGEQENICILPFWLFTEMKLNEGEMLRVGLVTCLEKANYVKLRPHKTEFINLPDPRSILEIHLRNFVCLTLNQTICIEFMKKEYYIDVLELKPKTLYNAVSLFDTDLNLEFAPPLDYVEPAKPLPQQTETINKNTPSSVVFEGTAVRLDGKTYVPESKSMQEVEFDPRKHKIHNGIRKEWNNYFKGSAISIG